MKNKDILLTLPGTLKIRDIKWLSVWCKRFTVNYGEIYIPKNLEIPEKVVSAFRLNSFQQSLQSFFMTNNKRLIINHCLSFRKLENQGYVGPSEYTSFHHNLNFVILNTYMYPRSFFKNAIQINLENKPIRYKVCYNKLCC